MDPSPITKIEDIRMPSLPSYPFPLSHSTLTECGTTDIFSVWAVVRCRYTLLTLLTPLPQNRYLILTFDSPVLMD